MNTTFIFVVFDRVFESFPFLRAFNLFTPQVLARSSSMCSTQ